MFTQPKSKAPKMNNDRQVTWEIYATAWKEPSPQAKKAALLKSVAQMCVYQDPTTTAHGHDALIACMLDFHMQVPGGHFVTTWFLAHHDVSIAKWDMVGGDGTVVGEGVSYGQYNRQGELVAMTGFFETPSE